MSGRPGTLTQKKRESAGLADNAHRRGIGTLPVTDSAGGFEWPFHNSTASQEASRYALIRKDDGIQLETYMLQDF